MRRIKQEIMEPENGSEFDANNDGISNIKNPPKSSARKEISKAGSDSAVGKPFIDIAPLAPKFIQEGRLTYSQAKHFLSEPLIEETTECRHITLVFLGWQNARNVQTAVRRLIDQSIGQFRPSINAVPIAIGSIAFREPSFILEDHNCIHVDVDVRMIVFKVSPDESAEGVGQRTVTATARIVLDGKLISGSAYGGSLGLVCSPVIPGVKPGDEFKARFLGVQFRNGICQIRAGPLNITRF